MALTGVAVATAAAIVTIALAGHQSAESSPRLVVERGVSAATLRGVWREVGSGRLIDIKERSFDLYHETKALCHRDDGVIDVPLDSRYALYDLSSDGAALTLYFHDLGTATRHFQIHERFERLPGLPAGCVPTLKESRFERPKQ